MGCFLGCICNCKRRKQSNSGSPRRKIDEGNVTAVDSVLGTEKGTNLVRQLSEKSVESKRVTFDSNVQTYELVPGYGSTDSLVENSNANDDERKNEDGIANSSGSKTFYGGDLTISGVGGDSTISGVVDDSTISGIGDDSTISGVKDDSTISGVGGDSTISGVKDDSTISNVGSYPQNNRYKNCQDSDDEAIDCDDEAIDCEDEDSVLGDIDDDDDDDNKIDDEDILCEVWSEAIPTASLESRKDMSLTGGVSEEVNSPTPSFGFPENVLSPVENLNLWKVVNSKGSQPVKPQEKENLAADGEAPSSRHQAKNQNKDAGVDSSLSNWLVPSETNTMSVEQTENSISQGPPSVRNIEDRPILGAWTVKDLKHFSAPSSPRKSLRQRPDDMPIIGTVGTYWKHGDEAEDCSSAASCIKKNLRSSTSYKEKKVNWHSTPLRQD